MISLLIGLLTFALWALCLFLILLILVQLPKKEAGAGLAFGAGAAEAVFGAGAGTPLSKFTRTCSIGFLVVALLLYILNSFKANESERLLQEAAGSQTIGETTTLEEPVEPVAPPAADAKSVTEPSSESAAPEASGEGAVESSATEAAPQPELSEAPTSNAGQTELTVEPAVPATDPNPNN